MKIPAYTSSFWVFIFSVSLISLLGVLVKIEVINWWQSIIIFLVLRLAMDPIESWFMRHKDWKLIKDAKKNKVKRGLNFSNGNKNDPKNI